MSKLAVTFWVLAVGLAASVLFHVKETVRTLEGELERETRRVEALVEEIGVLEAEWAYLNRPARLARLAERHLGMQPLEPTQISSLGALPPRLWPEGDLDSLIASVLAGDVQESPAGSDGASDTTVRAAEPLPPLPVTRAAARAPQ